MSEWIKVEKDLPHSEDKVWASWNGAGDWSHEPDQGIARYVEGLGWQPYGSMGWDWNVTHWMPLPQPPEE